MIVQRYFATSQLPVLVVANKSDKEVVRQDYILQPEAFCAKHKVRPLDLDHPAVNQSVQY